MFAFASGPTQPQHEEHIERYDLALASYVHHATAASVASLRWAPTDTGTGWDEWLCIDSERLSAMVERVD